MTLNDEVSLPLQVEITDFTNFMLKMTTKFNRGNNNSHVFKVDNATEEIHLLSLPSYKSFEEAWRKEVLHSRSQENIHSLLIGRIDVCEQKPNSNYTSNPFGDSSICGNDGKEIKSCSQDYEGDAIIKDSGKQDVEIGELTINNQIANLSHGRKRCRGRPLSVHTLIFLVPYKPYVLLVKTEYSSRENKRFMTDFIKSKIELKCRRGDQMGTVVKLLVDPTLMCTTIAAPENIVFISNKQKFDLWRNELGLKAPMQSITGTSFSNTRPQSIRLSELKACSFMADEEYYRKRGIISELPHDRIARTGRRRQTDDFLDCIDDSRAENYIPTYDLSNMRNLMLSQLQTFGHCNLSAVDLEQCLLKLKGKYKTEFQSNEDLEGSLLALIFMDSSWRHQQKDIATHPVRIIEKDIDIDSTAGIGVINREKLFEFTRTQHQLQFDSKAASKLNGELNAKDFGVELNESDPLFKLLQFWADKILLAISHEGVDEHYYKTLKASTTLNRCNRPGRDVTNLTASGRNAKYRKENPPENIPVYNGDTHVLNASYRLLQENLEPFENPKVQEKRTRIWNLLRLLVSFLNHPKYKVCACYEIDHILESK